MNSLRIGIHENRAEFQPGEELDGAVYWELKKAPSVVEVNLLWFTSGRGFEDSAVADSVRLENPQAGETRTFRFPLPESPYSFSGKLITLHWAVEAVAGSESARAEFALAPGGRAVTLEPVKS